MGGSSWVQVAEFAPVLPVESGGWLAAVAPVMTSGNGTANNNKKSSSNCGQHNGEAKTAQVIVKSHILTHLIEGFVIQEGAEPFPVSLSDRVRVGCFVHN